MSDILLAGALNYQSCLPRNSRKRVVWLWYEFVSSDAGIAPENRQPAFSTRSTNELRTSILIRPTPATLRCRICHGIAFQLHGDAASRRATQCDLYTHIDCHAWLRIPEVVATLLSATEALFVIASSQVGVLLLLRPSVCFPVVQSISRKDDSYLSHTRSRYSKGMYSLVEAPTFMLIDHPVQHPQLPLSQ